MARSHFGQMHIRLQAELFHLGDLFGRQLVVEILGHSIGVEGIGASGGRCGDPPPSCHLLDAGDQFLGRFAFGHFLPDRLDLQRFEGVVQIGQQSS